MLIMVLGIHSLGALWFAVDIQWQRQSMHASIEKNQPPRQFLTMFALTQADLKGDDFVRLDAKEIRYKGRLYDVIRVEPAGKTLKFYCIWDEHEDLLHQSLQKQVAQQIPYSSETSTIVNNLFEKLWVYQDLNSPRLNRILSLELHQHLYNPTFLSNPDLEVLSPPPQVTYS